MIILISLEDVFHGTPRKHMKTRNQEKKLKILKITNHTRSSQEVEHAKRVAK